MGKSEYEEKHFELPKAVSDEHWPRSEKPEIRVVLLRQDLQLVRVLPLPLGAAILEPNLDLDWKGKGRLELAHI